MATYPLTASTRWRTCLTPGAEEVASPEEAAANAEEAP